VSESTIHVRCQCKPSSVWDMEKTPTAAETAFSWGAVHRLFR